MKKILFLGCVLFISALSSCGEDKPVVTYEEVVSNNVHYPNFGATTVKTLWDSNRLCDDGYEFRVTKQTSGSVISSSDICDHCDKRWYNHEKK